MNYKIVRAGLEHNVILDPFKSIKVKHKDPSSGKSFTDELKPTFLGKDGKRYASPSECTPFKKRADAEKAIEKLKKGGK